MMNRRDYYEVLGLSKNASEADIKSAFRKLSRKWHPDMQSGKSDAEKKEAEEKFKELAAAYEVLSDKDKRARYDQFGFDGPSQFSNGDGMDMADFLRRHAPMFSDFFGGVRSPFSNFSFSFDSSQQRKRPDGPEDGADIQTNIQISFKQMAFGCSKEVSLELDKECPECHGTGCKSGTTATTCHTCHGQGMMTQQQRTPFGMQIVQSVCPACHGSGTVMTPCPHCHGTKRVPDVKKISVKIPAGIQSGQNLRIVGKGQCGVAGGQNGNLYMKVFVEKSDLFIRSERHPNDVLLEMPISPIVATLGGKVEVPTLNGNKKVDIPAGIADGTVLKVAKQGIKAADGTGDFCVKVCIEPLVNLTSEQKDILKKLNATLTADNVKNAAAKSQVAHAFYNQA